MHDERPRGFPAGRFSFWAPAMRDDTADSPQLDPDDELDLYLMSVVELLRCFGLGSNAIQDVVSWRLAEIYPLVVSPSETAH